MRVINVIVSTKENPIKEIKSFGIFEEQLESDVIEKAERSFVRKAVELGGDEIDAETDGLDDGYIDCPNGSVTIVWSYI